jgi:tetratricopeptide (TPR) repeat protein
MVLEGLSYLLKASPLALVLSTVLLLSACSSLNTQTKPNIVPVTPSSKADSPITSKPHSILNKAVTPEEKSITVDSDAAKNQDVEVKEINKVESNILSVLLAKAEKAKNSQQWLRAQRIYEQAIRVAPNNPEVFIKYGDLYRLMGGDDKAKSMYQRAHYLASGDKRLRDLVLEKLESF